MKYTVRKETPLKWYRFTQIIIMPIAILIFGYLLVSLVTELCGLHIGLPEIIQPVLSIFGRDVFHMGPFFWPVMAVAVTVLFFFFLVVKAWFASFRWKKSTIVYWSLFLILRFIAVTAVMVILFLYANDNLIGMAIIRELKSFGIQLSAGLVTLPAQLIAGAVVFIVLLIYTIQSVRYFIKRRAVFGKQTEVHSEPFEVPAEKEAEAVKEDKIGNTVVMKTLNNDEPYIDPMESARHEVESKNDPMGFTQVLSKMIDEDTAEKSDPVLCPHCGTAVKATDAKFCDNCGKPLQDTTKDL